MAKLILVVGLTGAGKTSYCTELALKEKAIVFSIDTWMKALYWQDMPENPDMKWFVDNSEWYRNRILRCEAFIASELESLGTRGVNVVLDLGFTSIEHRMRFLEIGKTFSYQSEIHYLNVSSEERWKRVSKRNQEMGATYTMNVSREMFDYIEGIFEPISESEKSLCSHFFSINT